MRFLIVIVALFFATGLFAQDTTRTRDRDNFQNKEQKKEQVQERKMNRFIDLDGDGINDEAMHRWQNMIKGGQHIDGNIESGQGEMNRNQNRTQMKAGTGEPFGDPKGSPNDPNKTQNKGGDKGKGKR